MKPQLFDQNGNSIKHNIPNPSEKLIDNSSLLTKAKRKRIIDLAAKHVGVNNFYTLGRASMCLQFAILVRHILTKENIESRIILGNAKYKSKTVEFVWEHFWIETFNEELIDCNIDSIIYHPDCPEEIEPFNYWGNSKTMPSDRVLTNTQEYSDKDIEQLETADKETVIWKNEIDRNYNLTH